MTKSQKLRRDIQADKVRYLHVSVQTAFDGNGVPMRTPPGKGATARKNKDVEVLIDKARGISGTRPTGVIIDDPIAEHSI